MRDAKKPPYKIRRLGLLRSAPWCVISPHPLPFVGCLGWEADGEYIYPWPTQPFSIMALELCLARKAARA